MLINSATASHASNIPAISRPSTSSGTSHYTRFVNAIKQIVHSQMRVTTATQRHQTPEAEAEAPTELNKLKDLDTEHMFSLYARSRSRDVREEIVKCYACQKSPADWQTDWNNLAPLCQTTSIKLLLQVKRIKDEQAVSPPHAGTMDVNGGNSKGISHLVYAARNGNVSTINLLLGTAGIDLYKGKRGWNAFLMAASKGHTEVVRRLLWNTGGLINSSTESGKTALILAVRYQHIKTISLLLNSDSIDTNRTGRHGTALSIACSVGNIAVIELLLPATLTSLNVSTKHGDTPLMKAVMSGHTGAVNLLLDTDGINTEIRNEDGDTALMIAQKQGKKKIIFLLEAHHTRLQKQLLSVMAANSPRKITGTNLKLEPSDCEFMFPLYSMSSNPGFSEDLIELYISRNSDEDWQNDWNNLAFECHIDALEFLLDVKNAKGEASQMDVNKYHKNARPHLMRASEHGDEKAIKLLLDNKVNPYTMTIETLFSDDATNQRIYSFGWNALSLTASNGYTEAVKVLLDADRNLINTCTTWNETALMLAIRSRQIETIELLLSIDGIDIEIENKDGETALMIAQKEAEEDGEDGEDEKGDNMKIVHLLQAHKNPL